MATVPQTTLKCIFLKENAWLSLKISRKFVPKVRNNNIPSLAHIMAWHRPGYKPLSETMMMKLLTHICVTRPQSFTADTSQNLLSTSKYKHHISYLVAIKVPWNSTELDMLTSSNGNIFRVTGYLCEEFTGHRWIPRIKVSDAELWCFLWSAHWHISGSQPGSVGFHGIPNLETRIPMKFHGTPW